MSPSPKDFTDRSAVDRYAAAWQAIMKSARSGNSWSGSEANRTFMNTGNGRFADSSSVLGLDFKDDGRALAVTDWDGDGDLDLWAQNRTAPRLRLMLNNTPAESRSVAFRLIGGKSSSRDAIGARLKLVLSDGTEMIQTLRAGSGFLSQSSKWIHFGIGDRAKPSSLQITWPDRAVETFTDIGPARRYRIEQGGETEAIAMRGTVLAGPARQRPLAPQTAGQMILPGRIPLPDFHYTPAGATATSELEPGTKPLLIVLFSGSCRSCGEELREFAKSQDRLRDGNLDVLALSVDELAPGGNPLAAGKLITDSGFPFPHGTIMPSSADHLRSLLHSLYDFPAQFSVPLSLLLDEQRRLFAVYRGQVSPELVLHDAAFSRATPDQLRDLAVPFRGRWFTKPIAPSELAEMIARPLHRSFPEHGLRYLEHALASATSPERGMQLQRRLAGGYYQLARQAGASGSESKAESHYRKVLALSPANFNARIDFGALLGKQGKFNEAEEQFRKALELSPDNELARKNLERLQQLRR